MTKRSAEYPPEGDNDDAVAGKTPVSGTRAFHDDSSDDDDYDDGSGATDSSRSSATSGDDGDGSGGGDDDAEDDADDEDADCRAACTVVAVTGAPAAQATNGHPSGGGGGGDGGGGARLADFVTVHVVYNASSYAFRMRRSARMEKLMRALCKKIAEQYGSVRFLCNETRVRPDDTPASLDIRDNDTIDANLQQVGGSGAGARVAVY